MNGRQGNRYWTLVGLQVILRSSDSKHWVKGVKNVLQVMWEGCVCVRERFLQMTLPVSEGQEYTGGLTFVAGRYL